MNNELTKVDKYEKLQLLLMHGNMAKLEPREKLQYYNEVCESLALNKLTRPFDFVTFQGKEVLYANKNCAEQLRSRDKISIQIVSREMVDDLYIVTARAINKDGRQDESIAAVPVAGLKGMDKANAVMKCDTKAKRRVTLSICGLGMLDETEIEDNLKIFTKIDPLKELEAPKQEDQMPPSDELPKPTIASLMTKYLALYKGERKDPRMMKIYKEAENMNIQAAEEYIKNRMEFVLRDNAGEEKDTA